MGLNMLLNNSEVVYMKEKYYSITQTAQLLGISKQTLVRYENKKLFPAARRNVLNGWREYTEDDIKKLRAIMGRTR
jgi:DNA-binding transcriptional MerR regulator